MWYNADPSAPKTQAARMLTRIARMLRTRSEVSFPIKAAMTIRLPTVTTMTSSNNTPSAMVVPITAGELSVLDQKELAETLSILQKTTYR